MKAELSERIQTWSPQEEAGSVMALAVPSCMIWSRLGDHFLMAQSP